MQGGTEKAVKLLSKCLRIEKSSESSPSELVQHQLTTKQDLFKKSASGEAHEDEEQNIQKDLAILGTSSGFQNIIEEIVSNNDQNIKRVLTKMSEDCSSQNNTNLTGCIEKLNFVTNSDNKDDLKLSYDHMYASNTDNVRVNNVKSNCQSAESEVKFLKEWLLAHLNLIQQQNDEILTKEKTIHILKRENEMLKERINYLDPNIADLTDTLKKRSQSECSCEDGLSEMTHDVFQIDDNNKDSVYIENDNHEPMYELIEKKCSQSQIELKDCDSDIKIKKEATSVLSETTGSQPSSPNNSLFDNKHFTITNSTDVTLKTIKMNIRRNRLCSASSAISSNDVGVDETNNLKKKKKRKSSLRDDKILMSNEHYLTQSGEVISLISDEIEPMFKTELSTNLEVPRWRVKVYTSCYSMEGTENLDDEVYNKRHIRLENDERRRKRWDVQRIREQRIVEKLKQRQDRIGSGSRVDDQSELIQSLWPPLDDIKYLEVCDQLPVSAFGVPIPRFLPSEFSLPWLSNPQAPHDITKKQISRKSTIRRKAAKR
ncbi:hypothetical protein FQA39_LY13540 [Lamprigera yunnana]|nr:hypothetical protein FQA39_LY13540 [Lamprigera yunnana]